jgi:dTDP-4-amino-4,6-dideoxygalactose transaminase
MIQLGYNFRLTDIQSALALSQIKRLDRFVSKRRKIANKYFSLLKNIKHIKPLIQINEIEKSALHIFVLNIDFTKLNISRNQLMKKLRNKGIGSQVHYIPIPMQPFYRDLGFEPSDYPNAMHFYNSTLSIPIFPKLKKRNVKKICAVLKEVVRENSSDL